MKSYLFVCQHNFTRSKFGSEFFRRYLKGKKINARIFSAGLGFVSYFFGRRVSRKIVEKADWIFVMEDYMKGELIKKFKVPEGKIVVLNILDRYGFFKRKNILDLDKKFKKINWEKYL